MTKKHLPNTISRYLLIANCVFISFNLSAITLPIKSTFNANNTLKYLLISSIKTDSMPLDSLLIRFNSINNLTNTLEKAQSFEKLGQACYEDYPDYCIRFLDSAQVYYQSLNKTKEQALCLQNICFAYTEKQKNYDKGLAYALKAVPLWQSINSVRDEANILKYIGFIYGEKEQYDSAFVNLNSAINKFEQVNSKEGVAVSYFDMAQVFKKKFLLDSAVYYLSKAKRTWVSLESPSRIFTINNALLNIYMSYKAVNNINALIGENENLYFKDANNAIYWRDIEAFYQSCIDYYDKMNNLAQRDVYKIKKKKYLETVKH